MRILCDVDGVVADLMEGFITYLDNEGILPRVSLEDINHHRIGKSSRLGVQATEYYNGFLRFMADDPYSWVRPLPESITVLSRLAKKHEVLFTTATMSRFPGSFVSKAKWLRDRGLGDVPICSIPSEQKHYFKGDLAIDDRLDICSAYLQMGTTPILFYQPWSVSDTSTMWLDHMSAVCDQKYTDVLTCIMGAESRSNDNYSAWRSLEVLIDGMDGT